MIEQITKNLWYAECNKNQEYGMIMQECNKKQEYGMIMQEMQYNN